MESIKVILNPTAGRGYGARMEPELRQALQAEGLDFDLARTSGPWHAVELTEQAISDGFEIVVAAGGDGTVNEVINGLMLASERDRVGTLGIIPVGSGSDFASGLGIPLDLRDACHKLAVGRSRLVDVGRVRVNGDHLAPDQLSRYFGNVVGIGFDGTVLRETLKIKHLRGLPLYMLALLRTVFLSFGAPHVTVEYDGERLEMETLMICVANGPREGGGFIVAPDAQHDDGLFDLLVADRVSRLAILGLIPHFLRGSHVGRAPIKMTRAARVTVSSPDDLIAHMDGEVLCTKGHRLAFEILPQKLRLRC